MDQGLGEDVPCIVGQNLEEKEDGVALLQKKWHIYGIAENPDPEESPEESPVRSPVGNPVGSPVRSPV